MKDYGEDASITESEVMTIIYALNQRAVFYETLATEYAVQDRDDALRYQKRADEARVLKRKINTGTLSIDAW